MTYKKVFSSSRFHTKSQNSFSIDAKTKSIIVGSRSEGSNSAYLGKVIEQGKVSSVLDYDVKCDVSFPHVIGIFGSRGSGKSFDLGVFLEGIFLRPVTPTTPAVQDAAIVFDVQDQFWTLGYQPSQTVESDQAQLRDLAQWGLSPENVANLQVLVPSSGDTQVPEAISFSLSPDQLSHADWLSILELERFSAMGQALVTLLDANGPEVPSDLSTACSSGQLSNFQQGTVDGLKWRLDSLAKTGIVTAQGVSVDELLQPGRLSVILMRNLSDSVRGLVVGVISRLVSDRMGRVQQARKVSVRTGNPTPAGSDLLTNRLWMVLDEAHVLAPSDSSTAATVPLIDYVKRGRDAGLSLIFATQQPSAVNSKLMSQVDITLTHMLGFEADLSAAIARMPTRASAEYEVDSQKASSMADLIRGLGPGEAIMADNASGRAFVMKIRPRVSAHGGTTPK